MHPRTRRRIHDSRLPITARTLGSCVTLNKRHLYCGGFEDDEDLPNLSSHTVRPLVGRTRCNRLSIIGVLLMSKLVLRVQYIVNCT